MKSLTTLASTAVAIALAGCAHMSVAPRAASTLTKCEQSNCHITVYVTPEFGIRVDKDPLEVTKQHMTIHWEIDQDTSGDYKFPSDGIKFSDDPAGQFGCMPTGNDKKFLCTDKNDDRKPHKYTIKLVGPRSLQLDPTIKNQG